MMHVDLDATFFYLPIIYCIHVLFTYILYFLGLGGPKKKPNGNNILWAMSQF